MICSKKPISLRLIEYFYRLPIFYNKTDSIALCCIAKCENDYILEFVDYYFSIGVDKIYIYDNNAVDGESLQDVMFDYVSKGKCEIINFRGKKVCQLAAYQDCYDKHSKEFGWIMFFDCDEFLVLNKHDNLREFLNRPCLKPFQLIHINWMVYGDSDLLYNDGRPMMQRFTKPVLPLDFKYRSNFPENNHIKTILRGGLKNVRWIHTSHDAIVDYYRCCNASGIECDPNSAVSDFDHSVAYLRHFYTKTISEWIEIKQKRGYPDHEDGENGITADIESFFKINKKTKEKEAILNEFSLRSNTNL